MCCYCYFCCNDDFMPYCQYDIRHYLVGLMIGYLSFKKPCYNEGFINHRVNLSWSSKIFLIKDGQKLVIGKQHICF